MKKCVFCDYNEIKKDIIYESKNFFVKVGFGLASPGHVLLISKNHYDCFAEIPNELDEEFQKVKKFVYKKIKEKFHEPIILEYYKIEQSVPHAHIHFIPKERLKTKFYPEYKIKEIIRLINPKKENYKIINSFSELKKIKKETSGYIFIEDKKSYLFTDFNEKFPSNNLRWRYIFNEKLKLKDIPNNWKLISQKQKEIDEFKRNETKRLF